jgi:hypothetical protein
MDSSSSVILLVYSPQRLYAEADRQLAHAHLSRKKEALGHDFLVKEASERRLLGQVPLSCKTLLIPATGSLELALLT